MGFGREHHGLSGMLILCWCAATGGAVAQVQPDNEILEAVLAWAEVRAATQAIELEWEESVPQIDVADSSIVDVYYSRFVFRWPDCLYTRRELLRTEQPDNIIDYQTDQDHIVRSRRERGLTETFVTPEGSFVQRHEGTNMFKVLAGEDSVTLESVIGGYVMHAPALLAAVLLDDVGFRSFELSSKDNGDIQINHLGSDLVYTLSYDQAVGETVLRRIEYITPSGIVATAYEYRSFRFVETCPYPIPRFRAEFRPTESRVTMKDGHPVDVEFYGDIREASVDRIVSYAAHETLPDSAFTPDLEGFTTLDESSGRLLDSEGNTIAQTTPKRKISRPKQWSTLIGAAGAAVLVFAAGAWWIRRRAA